MDQDPQPPRVKQTITRKQANWQIHVAGLNASKQAESAGIDRETSAHLLDSAVPLQIREFEFPPLSAGFLMMLPLVEQLQKTSPELAHDGGQLAALAFVMGAPEQAWTALRARDGGATFIETAFAYATQFSLAELRQMTLWMTGQMAALREQEDEPEAEGTRPGKPETSAGHPPVQTSSPSD